jgi:hypothetical protein
VLAFASPLRLLLDAARPRRAAAPSRALVWLAGCELRRGDLLTGEVEREDGERYLFPLLRRAAVRKVERSAEDDAVAWLVISRVGDVQTRRAVVHAERRYGALRAA